MNARLYDPAIGRFFSPDPQVQNPFSTQGYNRYSYCGNNPVMYTDPDGEFGLLTMMLVGSIINYRIHKRQGDVTNFWKGVGYWFQGALGGLNYALSPLNYGGLNMLSTTMSFIRNPQNAWHIYAGQFYYDEQMGHGFLQTLTRFSWEYPQTHLGYNYTQFRNLGGKIDRVDYLGGATFSTDECNGTSGSWGVTIGSYINMSISGRINKDFKDYVGNSQLYMHEYGHSLQSQMIGLSYLFAIGLPSLISCSADNSIEDDPYDATTHDYFYTETWANRLSSVFFQRKYGYTWNENRFPFHDYR